MSETIERLDAITARLDAATPGPWKADTGTRGDCVVWGPNGRFLMNMQAEPHWIEYPGETRMVSFDVDKRDAEFIADSRADVAYLLDLARKQASALERVEKVRQELFELSNDDGWTTQTRAAYRDASRAIYTAITEEATP